jgi:hypothetical protein
MEGRDRQRVARQRGGQIGLLGAPATSNGGAKKKTEDGLLLGVCFNPSRGCKLSWHHPLVSDIC